MSKVRCCQAKSQTEPCPFCQLVYSADPDSILKRFDRCFVIHDRYPVSQGHLLIIPYAHTQSWFTASHEDRLDIIQAIDVMREYLDETYHPDGYNIGMNCEKAAGQSVMHLHVHLIPRYLGDVTDPVGGVRGVIPQKQNYIARNTN